MSRSEIPGAVRIRVKEAARNRCGYCLSSQQYVMGRLEVEHIVPSAQGGSDDESNLWLSCGLSNRYKGSQVVGTDPLDGLSATLFNPRTQSWGEHFRWNPDATQILGLTATGRATVQALRLNNEIAIEVRRNWVLAGWHPPET